VTGQLARDDLLEDRVGHRESSWERNGNLT
jgi:hypothetical protein